MSFHYSRIIDWAYSDTTLYILFFVPEQICYKAVELDRHVDLPKEINMLKENILNVNIN